MIFLDQSGEGVQVELGPTVERELDDTILRLKGRGLGLRKIAEVINRSHMYVKRRIDELKLSAEYDVAAKELSERLGNPGSVPYGVGKIGWTPRVERIRKSSGNGNGSGSDRCPTCNGELGPIGDGSVFVCLACTRTCRDQAIENELRRERIMKEEAEHREAERRAAELEERRAARRDRKKAKKSNREK